MVGLAKARPNYVFPITLVAADQVAFTLPTDTVIRCCDEHDDQFIQPVSK